MRPPRLSEMVVGLYGAGRLAALDRAAAGCFPNTPEAFWRSFWAAAVAAPVYALLLVVGAPDGPPAAGLARTVAVEAVAYATGWVLFPLVMVAYVDKIGRSELYWRFISAWNWAIVLQVVLFLGVTSLAAGRVLPAGAGLVSMTATLAVFVYQAFVARVMLDISRGRAAVVVIIDVGLGMALHVAGRWLL